MYHFLHYIGSRVKQADVVLLGHPFHWSGVSKLPLIRREDLLKYERVTNCYNQGMSWPIWTVGWLDLENLTNTSMADKFHQYSFAHIKGPFLVFSDFVNGNFFL